MLKVKTGVTPKNLVIAAALANLAHEMGLTLVITSGTDGRHGYGSLHPKGHALDFRTKTLTDADRAAVISRLQQRLGKHYDVILEDVGNANEHGHAEWDPK